MTDILDSYLCIPTYNTTSNSFAYTYSSSGELRRLELRKLVS